MPRAARDLRNRRLNRSRRIAQVLVLGAGGVAGTGVGLMAHAAPHPPVTTTTVPGGGSGGTTTSLPHATTSQPHTTTSTTGHGPSSVPATTTTVWTPPVTTPHTPTTHCYTNASGQPIGCW